MQTDVLTKFVKIEQQSQPRYVNKKVTSYEIETNESGETILDQKGNPVTKKVQNEEKIQYPKVGCSCENAHKWLKLLECALCFYSWVKSESFHYSDLYNEDGNTDNCRADMAIRRFLLLYHSLVNKSSGTEDSLKIHQCKHIPHYLRKFGPLVHYSGAIGERNLKFLAKNPARRTQKRSSMLAEQSAKRYFENSTISLMHKILVDQGRIKSRKLHMQSLNENSFKNCVFTGVNDKTIFQCSGKYRVYFDEDGKVDKHQWTYNKSRRVFHKDTFFQEIYSRLKKNDIRISCDFIECFSLLKVVIDNGYQICFRGDPFFFQKPWFDWCLSKWEKNEEDEEDTGLYPTRIYLFIDPNMMTFDVDDVVEKFGKYWIVTRSVTKVNSSACTNQRSKKRRTNPPIEPFKSSITTKYKTEKKIRFIDVATIVQELFVIPDISCPPNNNSMKDYTLNGIHSFDRINEWSRKFINSETSF